MTQGLRKEMEAYSNERILNNIKQQDFFSAESVAIAKEIALERKLFKPENVALSNKTSTIKKEAKELADLGYSQQFITAQMNRKYNLGIPQATQTVHHGYSRSHRNEDSGSGTGIITGILVFLFLIRIILRIAANS